MRSTSGGLQSKLLSTQEILVYILLLPNSYAKAFTYDIIYMVMWGMRSNSGGLQCKLLLTQKILVYFLLLPNYCVRRQSSAAYLGLISAAAQM